MLSTGQKSAIANASGTNRKAAIAEAEVAAAATRLGISVLRPLSDHGRYDLAFDIAGRLLRVQCKWGRLAPSRDLVHVRVANCRYTPQGYVRTRYSKAEIDLLAAYCGELDRCFLLPVSMIAGRSDLHLRLTPPRNAQRACITLADDLEFAGAVAQLGERLGGTQEARGSSPLSSTPSLTEQVIGAHELRERFGYWMDRAAAGEDIVVTRHGRPLVRLIAASAG